jgi:hypothetical protein
MPIFKPPLGIDFVPVGTVRRATFWICWGLAFGPGAGYGQEQDPLDFELERQRLSQEAKALFPFILDGKLDKIGRCQISSEWLSAEIDEGDAKRYLEVQAHASLIAPNHGTVAAEVLDPKGLHTHLFCDKDATEANNKQRIAEFKKAFETDRSARLRQVQWAYTFPVFNGDYTRAAVVVQVEWREWWDPHIRGGWEGSNANKIYEKRNGTWVLLAENCCDSWEGSTPPLETSAEDGR